MPDDLVDDVAQKRESLENIIQREQDLKDEKDLEHLQQSAVAELAELTELIRRAPNKDTIYSALRHIRSAKSVAQGLSIIGNDHQYLQTRSFPSNKLHEKQKRFFSTRKKMKLERPRVTLSEATRQELEDVEPHVCAFCLKEDPRNCAKDSPDLVDWIECGECHVWVHTVCDCVEDCTNYVCSMCRV